MERLQQPTDSSCWATCISMVTGIDLALLPLDGELGVGVGMYKGLRELIFRRPGKWDIVCDDTYYAWFDMLYDNGLRMVQHDSFPHRECLMPVVIYKGIGEIDAHVVALDKDGIIVDPSNDEVLGGLRYTDVDTIFCNVERVPRFITFDTIS